MRACRRVTARRPVCSLVALAIVMLVGLDACAPVTPGQMELASDACRSQAMVSAAGDRSNPQYDACMKRHAPGIVNTHN